MGAAKTLRCVSRVCAYSSTREGERGGHLSPGPQDPHGQHSGRPHLSSPKRHPCPASLCHGKHDSPEVPAFSGGDLLGVPPPGSAPSLRRPPLQGWKWHCGSPGHLTVGALWHPPGPRLVCLLVCSPPDWPPALPPLVPWNCGQGWSTQHRACAWSGEVLGRHSGTPEAE